MLTYLRVIWKTKIIFFFLDSRDFAAVSSPSPTELHAIKNDVSVSCENSLECESGHKLLLWFPFTLCYFIPATATRECQMSTRDN